MNIGIIGAGMIGGTAARLFTAAGHAVAISNSRGPATLADLVAEIGPGVHATTAEEAARFGDVVLVAIPYGKSFDLPAAALAGKIVVDAGNYYPQRDGHIDLQGLSSSELLSKHLPGARVVKAFNTVYYQHLATQGDPALPIDERRAIFVAGDDARAKRVVSELIEELGFAAVDTGSLHDGGLRQEPNTQIYNKPLNAGEARRVLSQIQD